MGLGPSYHPSCRRCSVVCNQCQGKNIFNSLECIDCKKVWKTELVTYIAIIYLSHHDSIKELTSWWVGAVSDKNTYWGCDQCYNIIPKSYKSLFIRNENYMLRGK